MEMNEEELEKACIILHNAYEKAAVGVGWETQPNSRKLWSSVPEANKQTMRIALRSLFKYIGYLPPEQLADIIDGTVEVFNHDNKYDFLQANEIYRVVGPWTPKLKRKYDI